VRFFFQASFPGHRQRHLRHHHHRRHHHLGDPLQAVVVAPVVHWDHLGVMVVTKNLGLPRGVVFAVVAQRANAVEKVVHQVVVETRLRPAGRYAHEAANDCRLCYGSVWPCSEPDCLDCGLVGPDVVAVVPPQVLPGSSNAEVAAVQQVIGIDQACQLVSVS
jgi:hypothetical protein